MKKMKKVLPLLMLIVTLLINPAFDSSASAQDAQPAPKLFVGGGRLTESGYKEFLKLTGPDAKLIVFPTASQPVPSSINDIDVEKIKEQWKSRGFPNITVMHTNDREVASSTEFTEPLRTATAVWFGGGSQYRIADAYIGTLVEKELYQLLQRGGVIGGSSAGAAIQSRVMIVRGGKEPEISTGLDLLPGAIIDQHFLKRNRLSRLIAAVRMHPELIGFGIDEATAIVVCNNEYKIVGESFVLRVELIEGKIKIDAFKDGDIIPMADR